MKPLEAIDAITRAFDWLGVSHWRYTEDNILAVDNKGYITLPDDPNAKRFSLYGRIALEAGFHTLDHPLGDRVEEAYALAHTTLQAAGVDLKHLELLYQQEAPLPYIRNYIEDRYRVTLLLAGASQ